ncbi:MAG TPA: hypothetical protein VHB77_04615 [Planctomycetaceae bacterium]|nr:hypothetical protein [Planctomycetaceae bacterium]
MTIELNCPHCQKFLRTTDDKAGMTANCPGCGEPIVIPAPSGETAEVSPELEQPEAGEGDRKPCPVCGGMIRRSARKCRYCGEQLVSDEASSERAMSNSLDVGDVLRDTWEIYRDDMALVLGGIFVAGLISSIPNFAMMPVSMSVAAQQPNNALLQNELQLLTSLMQFLFTAFMLGGQFRLLLNVIHRTDPRFSDIFSGGRYFLRMFGGMILGYLALVAGCLLLIFPGIYLMMAFAPFPLLIVDRNLSLFDSFREAWRITQGHRLQLFVLMLVSFALVIGGYMACCVGLIVVMPFNWLMYVVVCVRLQQLAGPRPEQADRAEA